MGRRQRMAVSVNGKREKRKEDVPLGVAISVAVDLEGGREIVEGNYYLVKVKPPLTLGAIITENGLGVV